MTGEADGAFSRLTGRVRSEVEARVEQVRAAALTAASTLGAAIICSALAALVGWLVLFGVRIGSGTPWILSGLVVLAVLLMPAFSLWYLRRQFLFIASLPEQLGDAYAQIAEVADASEIQARFAELSGKRGFRLALAIASLMRWAGGLVEIPSAPQLGRVVTTVPLATGVGVIGTIAVVLLIPVFAIASGTLAAVN